MILNPHIKDDTSIMVILYIEKHISMKSKWDFRSKIEDLIVKANTSQTYFLFISI